MLEKIIIVDFGSNSTLSLARKIRSLKVYSEIVPFNQFPENDPSIKGVILSELPSSKNWHLPIHFDISSISRKYPILALGSGARVLIDKAPENIHSSASKENEESPLTYVDETDPLFDGIRVDIPMLLSEKDYITKLPENCHTISSTEQVNHAAFRIKDTQTWGVQCSLDFLNTEEGALLLANFLELSKCSPSWSPATFINFTISELKHQLGNDQVILALSGGVDSSVTAVLLHKAIGKNLTCIFVDHGLLRKNEFENVLNDYQHLGLNVIGINAKDQFYQALKNVSDPEGKRKIIGKGFIDVFDEEAKKLDQIKWLGQGTIYPDIVESQSISGHVVKSHHNVGGLPEKMNLKLVEPLRLLFKDEVRQVGMELGMESHLINRHPFPGPGLGIRILGDITPEKVQILQEVDDIYISLLKEWELYDKVWQAGAILLPVSSVGISDDKRTYESAVALRAVLSVDAMTAEWAQLPYSFLSEVSNEIITKVKGVNRVVYDISSKPPATIEWE